MYYRVGGCRKLYSILYITEWEAVVNFTAFYILQNGCCCKLDSILYITEWMAVVNLTVFYILQSGWLL